MTTVRSTSEAETRALGRALGGALAASAPACTVAALSGDLGTGKTALVRGICEYFGCAEQVCSPSFTLVNEYRGNRRVTHCDLYRMSSVAEMLDIGLEEILASPDPVLVEWAETAVPLLPLPRLELIAAHGDSETERIYTWQICARAEDSILRPVVSFAGACA